MSTPFGSPDAIQHSSTWKNKSKNCMYQFFLLNNKPYYRIEKLAGSNRINISTILHVMKIVEKIIFFHNTQYQMLISAKTLLLEMDSQELTHPDEHHISALTLKQLLDQEIEKATIEKRNITKNGNSINILLTTTLLQDESGLLLYFFTQILDLTKRKQVEQEALIL